MCSIFDRCLQVVSTEKPMVVDDDELPNDELSDDALLLAEEDQAQEQLEKEILALEQEYSKYESNT